MYNHAQGDSSINDILDMMKHFKLESQKSKDSYSIDFQSKNSSRSHFKEVRPRSPLSNITNTRVNNTNNSYHSNVFQKLYDQKKQMDRRKCLMQYETRRSKQQREKSQCTFSPNIKKKLRTQQYDSIDNESFYNKNVEWLQRKEKSIKIKQCEKNQENVVKLTFTPKINKFNKAKVVDNGVSIYQAKGVQDYLNRQKKVKKIQEFVQTRKKNPYSHVWNVKKGHFSHVV